MKCCSLHYKNKSILPLRLRGLPFNRMIGGSILALFVYGCSTTSINYPPPLIEQCPPIPGEIRTQVENKARAICETEEKVATELYSNMEG